MSLLERGRRKLFALVSIMLMPFLFSCNENINSESNSSYSESAASESNSSFSSEETSFSRDDGGFKIFDTSCFSSTEEEKEGVKTNFGSPIEGIELYPSMKLFLFDEEVPVYKVNVNTTRVWTPDSSGRTYEAYASFSFTGKVKMHLQCAFLPRDVVIRPLSANIASSIDKSRYTIDFEIDKAGQYLIETRQRTLHLFANELKETPKEGAIVFKKGLHDKNNDSRISSKNEIIVHSNERIYLEEGAFVRGRFLAVNASGFSIEGAGVIDGSTFPRNPNEGTATIPLEFQFCSDFKLNDFAVIDPAGWAFNLYFSSSFSVTGAKVISSRSNGDGISVQSCKDSSIRGCFIRTYDDSLVVKNYIDYRNNNEGETSGIHFSDCLLYTDLAQSMEIGYETIGERMEDISFTNITVLHAYHKAILSIHNANNAKIKNVRFENIVIEDASIGKGDGNDYLIDFDCSYSQTWSDNHKITPLGEIDGVKVKNVKVIKGIGNPKIKITGSLESRDIYPKEAHYVKNVTFENVDIYGSLIDEDYPYLIQNYAENIVFK